MILGCSHSPSFFSPGAVFELAGRIIIRVNAPRRPLQEFIFPLRQRTPAVLSAAVTCVDRLALRAGYSGKVLREFAGLAGLLLPLRGRSVGVGSPTARDVPREDFLGDAAFSGLDRLALAPRLGGLGYALDGSGDAASRRRRVAEPGEFIWFERAAFGLGRGAREPGAGRGSGHGSEPPFRVDVKGLCCA